MKTLNKTYMLYVYAYVYVCIYDFIAGITEFQLNANNCWMTHFLIEIFRKTKTYALLYIKSNKFKLSKIQAYTYAHMYVYTFKKKIIIKNLNGNLVGIGK